MARAGRSATSLVSYGSGLDVPAQSGHGASVGLPIGPAVLFICAVVVALTVSIITRLDNNSHSDTAFFVLLYGSVLPSLLWLWRRSRTNSQAALRIPDFRTPVITAFALLTSTLGFTYDHGHTIPDESAYQFQARVFAAGELKAEPMLGAPQNPAVTPPEIYFENQIDSVRGLFAKYPPAWPLMLSVGYVLRCPWLVNPVLGIILLLLVNHLARPWGALTQNLAVMFAACSAYTMLYMIGFMSHGFAAVIATGCLASMLYGVRTERLGGIILCFALVVVGTETRPYTGAVIALLCTGFSLYQFRSKPKLFWRSLVIISVAGLFSIALFLGANKIYTGNYLLSPYVYAHGSTKLDEITLDFHRILSNIETVWRWVLTATLCSTFPFVFLAAAYACLKERQFRRELICLALLFPMLMVAYLFQTHHSGSFDGERFYFEGYAAECVVAARGLVLLISNLRVGASSAKAALVVLAAVQVVFIALVTRDVETRLVRWRKEYRASVEGPVTPLIFLSGSDEYFRPKHVNWNEVHWRTARTVYLNDPGVERRDEVACRFHRPAYRVISYEDWTEEAVSHSFSATCPVTLTGGSVH